MYKPSFSGIGALFFSIALLPGIALGANDNAFTYQGLIRDNGTPVSAVCDLTLELWDSETGGTQLGPTNNLNSIAIDEGLFTVQLDFGATAFGGTNRWLEVAVQCTGDLGPTTLVPRQELTAAPRSFHSLRAIDA